MNRDRNIKIITLGETGVGKTSIIHRICKNEFKEHVPPIYGFDEEELTKEYNKEKIKTKLFFTDTAGQERYSELPKPYIRDCHIALLVFSDIKSLEAIENKWNKYYKNIFKIEFTKFVVVANKSDTFGDNRDEIIKRGKKFAEEIDNSSFITTRQKVRIILIIWKKFY